MKFEVFFDLICPWCWIGKRHFDSALAQLSASQPDVEVSTVWHPLVLLPETPPLGRPYQEFYLQRLGSAANVAQRRAQVQGAGRLAGLEFDFESIEVLPNTMAGHRLIQYAGQLGGPKRQEALIEVLFQAYFQHGLDIGRPAVLASLAARCGMEPQEVAAYLASSAGMAELRHAQQLAQHRGISGVPHIVLNHSIPLSGANPPEVLLEAMQLALRTDPATDPI
ncbi:DsbA family oxidoreductase [Crenobacter sp. SG2303]|uniref:DsbA family oxidoreductase n=1 Tax=Crenobacter oryzisoli TaxID=3056844 RepID=A0ABT7XPK2_9NEIS|nr:DsbA family oxidoreductase [Crenobacter sp. SG2303]MDN0075685.1 DsbA family oxidoreductase [Crenobacter sp. SG2303]